MSDLVAPPSKETRKAFFDRLTSSPLTSAYTVMREGRPADMPYIHVGVIYKGSGGTDVEFGVNLVQTITAFAWSDELGSEKVSEMMGAVYAALGAEDIVIEDYQPLDVMVEDDVLTPDLIDELSGRMYAQYLTRFRVHVTT